MKIPYVVAAVFALAETTSAQAGIALESFGVESSGPPQLFTTVGPQGTPGSDAGPGATAAWPVTVNNSLLNTLPATVQVNFPDRATVTLARKYSERRGAGFLWSGKGGDCNALFRQAPSGLKGVMTCGNAPYGLDHAVGSQNVRLSRYNNAGAAVNDYPPAAPPPGSIPLGGGSKPPLLDQTVDVLVLFNGSLTVPRWEFAKDIVDQIRDAMFNSTTSGQPLIADVRLSGAARISRNSCNTVADDLDTIWSNSQAIALRNYWAADVVIYVTCGGPPASNLLGKAFLPGYDAPQPGNQFAPFAYAVVLQNYAINPGDFVAAHEFAHTFGANHNPDHVPTNPTPIRAWAWDHWARQQGEDVPAGHQTILTYREDCLAAVNPCPRVLNYSNPDVIVDGWFRTGIANQRDNARLLVEIAPAQAQYRPSIGRIFAHPFE